MENLILAAVSSNSKVEQEQANNKLLELRSNNIQYFLTQCATIVKLEANDIILRQAAATLLSNAILLKNDAGMYFCWDSLKKQSKQIVKNSVMETLITKHEGVKRSCSIAIAAISAIQIPRGEWQQIIPILSDIVTKVSSQQMATASMALGYICSQFTKMSVSVDNALTEYLLSAILLGLKKSNEQTNVKVKNLAMSALFQSLSFFKSAINNPQRIQFILNTLLSNLNISQTVEISLQTLAQFCKHYYDYLQPHIILLFKGTAPIISNADQNSTIAIQIWKQIGQYQSVRQNITQNNQKTKYLLMIHESISELLMSQTIKPELSYDLKFAIVDCLTTLVSVCGEVAFEKITNFVGNVINSQDANWRRISVLAFSTLVQAKQINKILSFYQMGLPLMIKLLNDSNNEVIKFSLQGWQRIFSKPQFAKAFFARPQHQQNLKQFVKFIHNPSQQIRSLVFTVLSQLFPNMYLDSNQTSNKLITDLLQTFTLYAFNSTQNHLIDLSLTCVVAILIVNKNTTIGYQYLLHIIQKLQNNNPSKFLLEASMNVMSVGIRRITSVQANIEFMNKMYSFVIGYFNEIKRVNENGLSILAALAYTYKRNYQKLCIESERYLHAGLKSFKQQALYKGSLAYLQDISSSLVTYTKNNFRTFMNLLTEGINSNDVQRQTKIRVLLTIGDCISAVGKDAEFYVPTLVDTLQICFQAALNTNDDQQYLQQLRTCLIQLQFSLMFAVNDRQSPHPIMKSHFQKLLNFIMITTQKQSNPTVTYLKESVQLAFYSAQIYGQFNHINNAEFLSKLDVLSKFITTIDGLQESIINIRKTLSNKSIR